MTLSLCSGSFGACLKATKPSNLYDAFCSKVPAAHDVARWNKSQQLETIFYNTLLRSQAVRKCNIMKIKYSKVMTPPEKTGSEKRTHARNGQKHPLVESYLMVPERCG